MPLGLSRMLRLQQQTHPHRWQTRVLERFYPLHEVRAGRPGEVVNVFLVVRVRHGAVAVVAAALLDTGCADDPAGGHRHVDVVDAIVGKELRARVEFVRVPAGLLETPTFGNH